MLGTFLMAAPIHTVRFQQWKIQAALIHLEYTFPKHLFVIWNSELVGCCLESGNSMYHKANTHDYFIDEEPEY